MTTIEFEGTKSFGDEVTLKKPESENIPPSENSFRYLRDSITITRNYNLKSLVPGNKSVEMFRAEDLRKDRREVMIKKYLNNHKQYLNEKMIQEMIVAAGGHPNLLSGSEFIGDERIMISPFLRGGNLKKLLEKTGKLPPKYTKTLMLHLCRALKKLHENGIIHADVKDSNIGIDILDPQKQEIGRDDLVKYDGSHVFKLFDYDISYGGREEHVWAPSRWRFAGSIRYMSPEAIEGALPEPERDVYAAAVLGHLLLAGRLPFEGKTEVEIVNKHLHIQPQNVREFNHGVSKELGMVIEKGLEKDPNFRFRTIDEFAEAYIGGCRK